MAKYHETARKLREKWNIDLLLEKPDVPAIKLNCVLDLMRACSQLRQSKVIESLFTEVFKEVKTEYVDIEGVYGKYRKMVVSD